MSYTIRLTTRPGDEIVVSDQEYAGLLALGLVVGEAEPAPVDPGDVEMAAFVGDETSLTYGALRAAFGAPTRLHTDFTTRPNGVPEEGDDGVPFLYHPRTGAGVPTVQSGGLVITPTGPAAGYTQQDMGASRRVRRVGVEWTFGAGNGDGNICFGAWAERIPDPYAVPDSPIHLVITPTMWIYGVWLDGAFTQVADLTFPTPLAADATTRHRAEVIIVGDTAYFSLPDGTTATVTHALIEDVVGRFAFWEQFYGVGQETNNPVRILRTWADDQIGNPGAASSGEVARALQAAAAAESPMTTLDQAAPVSRVTVTLTGPSQEVSAEIAQTFTMPPSGRVLVGFTFHARLAAASWLIAAIATDSSMVAQVATQTCWGDETAAAPAYQGPVTATFLYTGTPGAAVTLHCGVAAPSGSGSVLVDPAYGYYARSWVTPLADD